MARERAAVAAGQLADLERDRGDLALADADLDPPAVRETPARLEVRLQEALQPLDRALGLRVARPAEVPVGHR